MGADLYHGGCALTVALASFLVFIIIIARWCNGYGVGLVKSRDGDFDSRPFCLRATSRDKLITQAYTYFSSLLLAKHRKLFAVVGFLFKGLSECNDTLPPRSLVADGWPRRSLDGDGVNAIAVGKVLTVRGGDYFEIRNMLVISRVINLLLCRRHRKSGHHLFSTRRILLK